MDAPDRTAEIVPLRRDVEIEAWRRDLMIEMQHQVVGKLVMNPDHWPLISFLRPEHFQHPWCAAAMKAFVECIDGGETPTPMAIVRRTKGAVNFKSLLVQAGESLPIVNIEDYAGEIFQDWHYRRAAELLEAARLDHDLSKVFRHRADYDAVMARIRGDGAARMTARSAMDGMMQRIADIASGEADDGIVSTGWRALDDDLGGGYRPGELVIVAARPGMGKTIFALSTARNVARSGRGVLIHSLEVEATQVAARLASDEIIDRQHGRRIQYGRIMKARLSAQEQEMVYDAAHALRALPFEVDARGGLHASDIATSARQYAEQCAQQGKPLGLVVIDYLGLMRHGSGRANSLNRAQEIGDTTMALKQMAKELGITVVLLVQLNRDVEKRDLKKPTLADLRDSGSIEQDADVVMFLYREEYYERLKGNTPADSVTNIMEVITAKNRPGKTGLTTLACDITCNAIRDLGRL